MNYILILDDALILHCFKTQLDIVLKNKVSQHFNFFRHKFRKEAIFKSTAFKVVGIVSMPADRCKL